MPDIRIRQARIEDIKALMPVYDRAKVFMADHGNVSQWIDGYPSEDLIRSEIEAGHCHVCETSDGRIAGTFCFIIGEDPTYEVIEDGQWCSPSTYGTIHRLASSGIVNGIADACISWCWSRIRNLRADTHADNTVMQNILSRNGFIRCGIIHTDNGSPRIAYQKYSM